MWGQAGSGLLEGLKLAQQEKQTNAQIAAQMAMMERQAMTEERQAAALSRQAGNDATKNFMDLMKQVDTNPVEALEMLSTAAPSDLGVRPEQFLILRGRASKLAPQYQRYGQVQAKGISDELSPEDLQNPENVQAIQRFGGDNAFKFTEGIRMRGRADAVRDTQTAVEMKAPPQALLTRLMKNYPDKINDAIAIMERMDPNYAAAFKQQIAAAEKQGGVQGQVAGLQAPGASQTLADHEGRVSQAQKQGTTVGEALGLLQPGVSKVLGERDRDKAFQTRTGTDQATNNLDPTSRVARKIDSETALNQARAAVIELMKEDQMADKNWANIRRAASVLQDIVKTKEDVAILGEFMKERGVELPVDLMNLVQSMSTEAAKHLAAQQGPRGRGGKADPFGIR